MNLFPNGPKLPEQKPLWEAVTTQPACTWTEDDDGNWHTDCGEVFVLTEGTPTENRMRFCHRCGKPLKEVAR